MANEEVTAFNPKPRASQDGALAPGTLLNGMYRIERRLGVGGMGEVYRATNIANDEVDAIKIIGRGRTDQATIEAMFRKEARVLSRIRSPAVAQLKLFTRDPQLGILYFITDFIKGESLLDRLKRQPANPDELRALLRRVLTGLQAVHEAGAVHRDLSPDNIILKDGKVEQATIIDFGIAKELDPSHVTIIGDGFAGKLGYIAPEQLGFSGAMVGPWTDLYSLALVGAAFAAGRPLDMGATMGTAEEARRRPVDLGAIPLDLREVFAWLLTYDWRARPQTATDVLAMLDQSAAPPSWVISAPPPLPAPPPPPPPPPPPSPAPAFYASPPSSVTWQDIARTPRQRRQNKIIAAVAAVVVLLVIGVVAVRALFRSSPAAETASSNLTDIASNGADATVPVPVESAASDSPPAPAPVAVPTAAAPMAAPTQVAAAPTARPTPRPEPTQPPQSYRPSVAKVVAPPPMMMAVPSPPPPPPRVSQVTGPQPMRRDVFSMDDYPSAARRAEAEGRVVVRLSVGSDGRATGCTVASSSGNGALDTTSCRIAMARLRFMPAKDSNGNPMASTYNLPVNWKLERE